MASIEEQLVFAKFVGTLHGAARTTAEKYPGLCCYKDLRGGHFWVQLYYDNGEILLLSGRDSTLPGLDIEHHDPADLAVCDCGQWMPATKAQGHDSKTIVATVYNAHRLTN